MLAFIITLFSKRDNWWEISLLVWFGSILFFWCFFSFLCIWKETKLFIKLVEEEVDQTLQGDSLVSKAKYFMKQAYKGCYKTMQFRLSGKHYSFKRRNEAEAKKPNNKCSIKANCNLCFEEIDDEKLPTLDEVLGRTSYVTKYSWNLEKLFCRRGGLNSAIPITSGASSMTIDQINSSMACNIIGNLIIVLLFCSAIVWFNPPSEVLGIIITLTVISFIVILCSTYRLIDLRRDIENSVDVGDRDTLGYWVFYQHSMPKPNLVWVVLFCEVLFLYVLPLAYLCTSNSPGAM